MEISSVAAGAEIRAAILSLTSGFSVEITPREADALPETARLLAPGSRVYITFLPRVPFVDVVSAATRVRAEGLRPVVHLAARSVADHAELDRTLGTLADTGVEDLLLIAGSLPEPVGSIADTLEILDSAELRRRTFASIGVAGHPEGNPGVDPARVEAALIAKNTLAREHALPLELVTQFCFAAEPVIAWERRIREAGNTLPIQVGLPGLTSPARLVRFGISCGIGPSLAVLRKQTGGVLKLATRQVYRPSETLRGLAGAVVADPESLLRGLHFFPFGALAETARWAGAVSDGAFELGPDGRLTAGGP